MLSKIAFFESGTRGFDLPAERERVLAALRRHLNSDHGEAVVKPAQGGTLGVCFDAVIAGERRFLKTHLPDTAARERLAGEAAILHRLHGDAVVQDRFELSLADGTGRLCLVMPAFTPLSAPLRPEVAAAMVEGWSAPLRADGPDRPLHDLTPHLACARRALTTLAGRGLLTSETAADVGALIALLEDRLASLPRALCHGDFGPNNVMLNGVTPIAIDWEDAFSGVAGYDYLYWLTFMENRPFLHDAAFGRTGLVVEVERAILVLAVLLKSYLAVLSGAYLTHKVTAEARIAGILGLPG
ncbi:hypothetical protein C2U70_13070 [Bradyrhizobium guangdongense]|uniref:phosphotransferase family protein n=1 Tax=Bradyrhizobium guangdongense TaxID=1325090 RepID=UPI00112C5FE1|nr:aminoglycoside phosphotransferase family protein [Bradyrhizobium guangdongense]TPQ36279.1 hypothetical protein C2U70_13070 [Bradyrhizobium guangdongense]